MKIARVPDRTIVSAPCQCHQAGELTTGVTTEAHDRLEQRFMLPVPADDESGFLKETELPVLLRKLVPLADKYAIRDHRQNMGTNLDCKLETHPGSLHARSFGDVAIDYLSRAHSGETHVLSGWGNTD